tara:strand:+ start:509 stop:2083 length:1575 start_codon:yes stop_codon:yes gene_type:complete
MADLSTKTLAEVKTGWLHSIVEGTGAISSLSNSKVRQISDGDGNVSDLFLTKGKGVYIGTYTDSTTFTANPPALSIKNLNPAGNPALSVETSNATGFKTMLSETTLGSVLSTHRQDTGSNETQIISHANTTGEGSIHLYPTKDGATTTGMHIKPNANLTNVGINVTNPVDALHILGDLRLSAGIVKQSTRAFYVDKVNGNDANKGWTLGSALQTIDEALSRIHMLNGLDIVILLVGKDNSSSGNISDNDYEITTNCTLRNCTLSIEGISHDSYTNLSDTDVEMDYPRLTFTMETSLGKRLSKGFKLNNCQVSLKHLRIVTPIYSGAVSSATSVSEDGLFKASGSLGGTEGGNFGLSLSYTRTEIGDAPIVSGGKLSKIDVIMYRNRIIRSNTSLTYGSIGQTGGQDNSGTASVPTWNGSTHFVNQVDSDGKMLGLLTDTHCGSIFAYGDTEVYDGANAGVFGAFPSTDSSGYSYSSPTTNDQQETEKNLFGNRTAQYTETTDGSTTGKTPINFNTNRFAGWYTY